MTSAGLKAAYRNTFPLQGRWKRAMWKAAGFYFRPKTEHAAVSTEDIARDGQIFLSRDVRMDELARHVSFLAGKLHIPVEVIRHADEAGSPDIRDLLSCGKDIRGWYDIPSQRICLYLPHARGKADVERTLLHEGVAHYGLRKLAGPKHMDAFLDDIFNGCGEKVRDEILRMAAADKTDIRVATEEYLARMAEDGTDRSLWDRIVTPSGISSESWASAWKSAQGN